MIEMKFLKILKKAVRNFIAELKLYFAPAALCCVKGRGSALYETAKISNNMRIAENIRIGEYTHVRGELLTFAHGGAIRLGDYCYVGEGTRIWSGKLITIGDRVLISHNCNIFDNITHPYSPQGRHDQFKKIISSGHPADIDLLDSPVTIEDDVLIGAGSIILKGIKIGRGAIIGAGSVVTKNVSPYTIVAGNPAKVIRELTSEERK